MNAIVNNGFASPYIKFNFETGSIEPLNTPPSYFMSLVNNRTTDKACTFTLTLVYVPGNFGEKHADLMHQLLLTSVTKSVTYEYGYITPGGGLVKQMQHYSGLFTQYTESINEGYLTYTITGVAHAVKEATSPVNVTNFLQRLRNGLKPRTIWGAGTEHIMPPTSDKYMQPSVIVEKLITEDTTSGIRDYFENYDIDIVHTDERVDITTINIDDGNLHDVFFGKSNTDQTKTPSGFVSYSVELQDKDPILNSGYLSQTELTLYYGAETLISHGLSGQLTEEMHTVWNRVSALQKIPYICFYDNVVTSENSPKHGTFHYVPKYNRQPVNIFNYVVGNSVIDGDVLEFSVDYDGAVALASRPGLEAVKTSIDVDGELVGSNYNVLQNDGFIKQSYNTLSGFNESVFLTESVISEALDYPFTANMTIIGQTDCNQLMDVITVNVYLNGLKHPGLSGNYTITGIEDNLSSNGFTTTFNLVKKQAVMNTEDLPNVVGNMNNITSKAYYNQSQISSNVYE